MKLPLLYWKLHEKLEKHGLDDASIAREFRINKKDIKDAKKELEEYKDIQVKQEYWFGRNPYNGKKKKGGVKQ